MNNKAIHIKEPYDVSIIDVDMPTPKDDEILMKVMYGGICGSDYKVYFGKMNNVTYPIIAGHEFSGEVIAVGKDVSEFKVGEIVTSVPYYGCDTCYPCRQGWFNCCENNKCMGVGGDGGFRNYVAIPAKKVVSGRGINARTLALIEPFSNSLNLVKRIDPKAGEKMLVFGAGPIGLFAMMAAKARGALVYLADTSETRLEFAKSMGADGVVNVISKSPEDYTKEITGDVGFDICVEAVGSGEVFKSCLSCVCCHGTVCVIGMTTVNFEFNSSIISFKEMNIVGARNSTKQDFIDNIDSVVNGVIEEDYLNKMITAEYHYTKASEMYKELETEYGNNMKVVIDFQD